MRVITLLTILFITGCATTSVTSSDSFKLSLGQSKADVVEILGEPQRVSTASNGREVFGYDVKDERYTSCLAAAAVISLGIFSGECNSYLDTLTVTFLDGKVSSYKQIDGS